MGSFTLSLGQGYNFVIQDESLCFSNNPPTYFFTRIFLSYQSRQAILETELESKLESVGSCGCLPSDGSFPGLWIHIACSLGGRRFFNSLCKVILSSLLFESYFLLLSLSLILVKIYLYISHFLLSHCMSWIVFLKTGKRLPRLYTVKLATTFTADECAETILGFINTHVPGAQELVAFFCT